MFAKLSQLSMALREATHLLSAGSPLLAKPTCCVRMEMGTAVEKELLKYSKSNYPSVGVPARILTNGIPEVHLDPTNENCGGW